MSEKLRLSVIVDSQFWTYSSLALVLINIANDYSHYDNSTGVGE